MTWRKAVLAALLIPLALAAGYVGFLWVSYKSEAVTTGAAYGFTIGESKAASAVNLTRLREDHSGAAVYVTFGPRAGDHFTVPAEAAQLDALRAHQQWDILLDGEGEFWNTVQLTFEEDRLVRIYRHRQYFELP